jgi:hypothetical protein
LLRLERGALWHYAGFKVTPQSDQRLAREGHDQRQAAIDSAYRRQEARGSTMTANLTK